MSFFQYHPDILTRFPNIVCGLLIAKNMTNCPTLDPLRDSYQEEQQIAIKRIGTTPLSELDSLAAWRLVFRNFGVNPTKYRNASEALLRRLIKKGDIPSINTIVDICNMVSIRYELPVAAFDTLQLSLPITVCFAEGNEDFTPLFSQESEHPDSGEVIFIDKANMVVARRWCWRQSDGSATRMETKQAIFTIEAHHDGGKTVVNQALQDLHDLLDMHAGGDIIKTSLDAQNPIC